MWQLLVGPVSDLLNTVLKRVLPAEKISEAERLQIESQIMLALSAQEFQTIIGQLEINREEAKSANWFVAGWRPACGWVGATALAWHFVLEPLLAWTLVVVFQMPIGASLPKFDIESLMTILMGMLGLGSMRSFEKWAKVEKQH